MTNPPLQRLYQDAPVPASLDLSSIHGIQIQQSGLLMVVGVFNNERKGKFLGELFLCVQRSDGTWIPNRVFHPAMSPIGERFYWSSVEFSRGHYNGQNVPVLRVHQKHHQKVSQAASPPPIIEILI